MNLFLSQPRETRVRLGIWLGVLMGLILFWNEIVEWRSALPIVALFIGWLAPYRFLGWSMAALLFVFYIYLSWFYPSSENTLHAGGVLFYTTFSFSMVFFGLLALLSCFVLPVRTRKEWWEVFYRLIWYLLGEHGPAIFVKQGQIVAAPEELKRKGPGVILVDPSSAVVLQREYVRQPLRKSVRVEGPGIVFMKARERLPESNVLDLRKQIRFVNNVLGLTREGIEVSATITVIFRLAPPPGAAPAGQNDRPCPLNPDSAFKAIYGQAVGGAAEVIRWTDLPLIVAKEFYRDMLSQETLDHLYQPTAPSGADPLAAFKTRFREKVLASPVLKERGIEVLATILCLTPGHDCQKDGVKNQRIVNWQAEWQRRQLETKAGGDLQVERIRRRARLEAQTEEVIKLAQSLRAEGMQSRRVTALRIFQALESAVSDPSTRRLLPADTIEMLVNVREWLQPDEQEQRRGPGVGPAAAGH